MSPIVPPSTHFCKNTDTQSKDPRNCPTVFFQDCEHWVLVSLLLREPIVAMPIVVKHKNFAALKIEYGDITTNEYHITFHKVVRELIFKMVEKVKKRVQKL